MTDNVDVDFAEDIVCLYLKSAFCIYIDTEK